MDNIDFERLREDLIDYFGTAMMQFPMAMMDLSKVENASCEELIMIKEIIDKLKTTSNV